ncbi:MBL fold metallo-hydrolase [Streptomyces sp. SID4951]|nr:MBL fold metallo-hydrolase [Streptomyces sp. SID4951]
MRFVTYASADGDRTGVLNSDRTGVLNGELIHALPEGTSLLGLLGPALRQAGERALTEPADVVALTDVTLKPPIPRPPSIRDCLCFLDHLRACRKAVGDTGELEPVWYEIPAFYFANPATVIGPYDDVPISPGSAWFDFELEIAAVIGTAGRDLTPEQAEGHIAGYGREVHLIDLGPAHTEADTVVHVPDAGVLFAGDLLFIGCTPIVWSGPIANWIAACDAMIGLGASTVVPGHGPVTDADGIRAVRDYFRHIVEQADAACAKGLDFQEAAFGADLAEYAGWLDAERIVVNIYRRYREIRPDQPVLDRFALFALMAEWDSRRQSSAPRSAGRTVSRGDGVEPS